MTVRSVGSQPVVRATTTSAPAAPAAPQAQANASTGYAPSSSFDKAPASASSASTGETIRADASSMTKASEILGKTSGGEALKKLIDSGLFLGDDAEVASKEFEKIAGSLSPEDAETVRNAISFGAALGGCYQLGKMLIDNMMNKIKETMQKGLNGD